LILCFGRAPKDAGDVEIQVVPKVDSDETMALYYGAADVVALASRAETSPVVIPEAWASHRPVVATRLPATAEMIEDGVTGYLADFGDARSFATALEQAMNPQTSGSMLESARRRAAQHEVGRIADTWLDWFQKLMRSF
jgi:glycosyltransferase involved in cell wall biosynthesis